MQKPMVVPLCLLLFRFSQTYTHTHCRRHPLTVSTHHTQSLTRTPHTVTHTPHTHTHLHCRRSRSQRCYARDRWGRRSTQRVFSMRHVGKGQVLLYSIICVIPRTKGLYRNSDRLYRNSDSLYGNSDSLYGNSDSLYGNSDSLYGNSDILCVYCGLLRIPSTFILLPFRVFLYPLAHMFLVSVRHCPRKFCASYNPCSFCVYVVICMHACMYLCMYVCIRTVS
jgi:hypothetical protein